MLTSKIRINDEVKNREMKLQWNNKFFPSLEIVNVKIAPYRGYGKLGQVIVADQMIPLGCYSCATQLYIPRDSKIKDASNHLRYGRVYYCKYSLILGYHNTWIIMKFLDDVTDKLEYEHINIKHLKVMLLPCH